MISMSRCMTVATLAAALGLGAASPVLAGARLVSALPAPNAKLIEAPTELVLKFSASVEPARSVIELRTGAGSMIATSKGKTVCVGASCRLTLSDVAPGVYEVQFHVVSTDGQAMDGGYAFTLGN